MNYHNITYPDQNNGDGLRVVVWVSGCSHHCPECQNPQTWNPHSGIEFDNDAKQEILDQVSKDYISGITWSGGDPMFESNIETVLDVTREIKKQYPNKTVWLYTGYKFEQLIWPVITDDFNPERDKRLQQIKEFTKMRDSEDSRRYMKLYGIDNSDLTFADLVIDTKTNNPEQIVKIILDELKKRKLICEE